MMAVQVLIWTINDKVFKEIALQNNCYPHKPEVAHSIYIHKQTVKEKWIDIYDETLLLGIFIVT